MPASGHPGGGAGAEWGAALHRRSGQEIRLVKSCNYCEFGSCDFFCSLMKSNLVIVMYSCDLCNEFLILVK